MATGLCSGRWTIRWLNHISVMLVLSSPVVAHQHDTSTLDEHADPAWQKELQAYQNWQVAMEQKKRDLAFAELQLNWLKKQVEIAHQRHLLKPSVTAVQREPINCIRVADGDWQLEGDDLHWSWGNRTTVAERSQPGCF